MAAQIKLSPGRRQDRATAPQQNDVQPHRSQRDPATERLSLWFAHAKRKGGSSRRFTKRRKNLRMSAVVRKEMPQQLLDDLGELSETDTFHAARAVSVEAATTVAGLALATAAPITVPIVTLILGVRGRYIANLMHAASHRSLTSYPKLDEVLGHALATVGATSFEAYCEEHLVHHRRLGDPTEDPKLRTYEDMGLMQGENWTKLRLVRAVARASLKSVSRSPRRALLRQDHEPAKHYRRRLASWVIGLVGLGAVAGWAPLTTFLIAQLGVKPIVNLATDVANHAGLIGIEDDPVLMTRGFDGNLLVRMVFGGYQDDLAHFVHHWAPGIPWNNELQAASLILDRFPRAAEIPHCEGFIWSRTPSRPSVLDDIVTRLNNNNGETT